MGISAQQWNFIACRLLSTTDTEACQRADVGSSTLSRWKQDDEFAQAYEAAFKDGVRVAQEYTRKNLGQAAVRLAEGLDATVTVEVELSGDPARWASKQKRYVPVVVPDHRARLKAVELLFRCHGLLQERGSLDLTSGGKALRILIDGNDG